MVTGTRVALGVQVTYKCRGPGGQDVAVKAVSLAGMTGWRDMERLEREAAVLQLLDHPGIPRFVESFEIDTPRDRTFFLVQVSENLETDRDKGREGGSGIDTRARTCTPTRAHATQANTQRASGGREERRGGGDSTGFDVGRVLCPRHVHCHCTSDCLPHC